MASSGILRNETFNSWTETFCLGWDKVLPEEVLPGQVAMVLLVQTREPRIQTLNLINY